MCCIAPCVDGVRDDLFELGVRIHVYDTTLFDAQNVVANLWNDEIEHYNYIEFIDAVLDGLEREPGCAVKVQGTKWVLPTTSFDLATERKREVY
jgi:hypothetical protein